LKYLINCFQNSSIYYLGSFGQICVSLFFFLGGYGLWCISKKGKLDILNNIKKLYISYWKVFLVFIPIGFIFFSKQETSAINSAYILRFNNFSWQTIISDFFGISSSLNGEWWFFRCYIFAIITFPILKKLFSRYSATTNIFIVIIFNILSNNVLPALGNIAELGYLNNNYLYTNLFCIPYISCFYLGIVFAKDNLIIKLRKYINDNIKLNIFVDISIILVIIYLRELAIGRLLDILYVPFFIIVSLDIIKKNKYLEGVLYSIGCESTNMWLIHSFFCYYFCIISSFVTYLEWAVPCLFVLVFLSFVASKLLNKFWDFISLIYNKICSYLQILKRIVL
jgi:hypothetical protein